MKESNNVNIGIDISQIVYEGTGVSRFTNGLVNAILDLDRTNRWLFFFSSLRRNLDPEIERKIVQKGHKLIKWKLPPTALSFLFNGLHSFSKLLTSNIKHPTSLDWFITSDWTEPPLPVNKATIVHDLVYLRYPETVDSKILHNQKKRLTWVKRESRIIFADSQSTKSDLVDLLNFDPKKIYVNFPGVDVKKRSKEQINLTLKKYTLKRPFILTVGKLEPRKNIDRLIKSYSKVNNANMDLVVVGLKGWKLNEVQSINRLDNSRQDQNIKFLGFVNDNDLFALYSSCLFFIFPSLWEGFGYPVVEAMKLGVPVATSKTSSFGEIAKDAAYLFDPLNVDEIFHCINMMKSDEKLRKDLVKKGLERSKMFTWKNYYNRLVHILYDNRS